MTKFLEENNIDVPDFARKEEGKLSLEQENCKHVYALGVLFNPIYHLYVSYIFMINILIYQDLKPLSLP